MGDPKSHSLLLERGLFRVFLPWPPKAADGTPIDPEFTIEVVRDPTGCNTQPAIRPEQPDADGLGVSAAAPGREHEVHHAPELWRGVRSSARTGLPPARDPETGLPTSMNMMADARVTTLKTQAVSAAQSHLQFPGVARRCAAARASSSSRARCTPHRCAIACAGNLMEPAGPPGLGVRNVANEPAGVLGNNTTRVGVSGRRGVEDAAEASADEAQRNRMRESIARGHDVFMFRTFWIRDVQHLTTVGLGNPTKRTCSTCHGMHMTGMDVANGWMDLGTTNLPWAARGTAESVERAQAADAAVQDHVQAGGAAACVPGTRDLHAGPRSRADYRQVHTMSARS